MIALTRSHSSAGAPSDRSGGGLIYSSYAEFAAALDRVRSPEGRALGDNGRQFVAETCSWDRIVDVYGRAIERAAGGAP